MSNSHVSLLSRILGMVIVSFFVFIQSNAQLCQGSLGDPIVNKTFGAGTNPGAPLAAATTSYQYVSFDCPSDGFYTVRSNTNACFGNSWHSLARDHTGDPNGYFMLVNASLQPSAFYLDTVKGLCPGTTFEFAAWVMNVLLPGSCSPNPVQPNLTFTIERTDGTVLQTYNTGTIPTQQTASWNQFGFFFTTPANASDIVLRIFNNSQGGCGNDLALDDITFRPCGPQLVPSITGSPITNVSFCEGFARSYTFNCAVSAGFNNPSFQWQQNITGNTWTDIPGATTTTLNVNFPSNTVPGTYSYRLAAAEAGNLNSVQCRVVSQVLTVQINPEPVTTAGSNAPLCEKSTLSLTATGGSQYDWTGPGNFTATGSTVQIANAQVSQSGKYYVLVTSTEGCEHLDSVTLQVNPAPIAATSFATTTICQGENVQLSATGNGTYQWLPNAFLSSDIIPNPVAVPIDTTSYDVIVTNQFGCKDTATALVNVIERPRANAGTDKTIIKGTSVLLDATAAGQNLTYSWTPAVFIDNTTILQPTVTPPRDTIYVLTVTSTDGCGTATDAVKVSVYKDVYIPTAFTPNGDGLNDTWFIPALAAYPEYEISVFNRQGQLVYYSKNNNRPWNGKYKGEPQPAGAYVYMVKVKAGGLILKGPLIIIR